MTSPHWNDIDEVAGIKKAGVLQINSVLLYT